MTPPTQSAAAVERRIASLYGEVDLARAQGVVHVAAVWPNAGSLVVIKIGPTSPKSETDLFVLNLTRARADVIVVTGKILRDEPELRYELGSDSATGLQRWRAEVAGKCEPPRLCVLTSGNAVDLDHPALHGWARPIFITGPHGAARLGPGAARRGFCVAGVAEPSVGAAIGWARANGAQTVSIEAGPSTVRSLYVPDPQIDEVMLSEYRATLARELRGPELLPKTAFTSGFRRERPAACAPSPEESPWRFSRYVRFRANDAS